jgi:hypothetical protein
MDSKKKIICIGIIMIMLFGLTPDFVLGEENPELVNLALNKPVTIYSPDKNFDVLMGYGDSGTPVSNASMLTSSNLADTNNWNGGTWFKFYRNMKRDTIVDLGSINTVKNISMTFAQRNDVGIVPPYNIKLYVSNDGVEYKYLNTAEPDVPLYIADVTPGTNNVHKKTYMIDKLADDTPLNVQARYVKLSFVVNVWGFADKITIMGKQGIADGAQVPPTIVDMGDPLVNSYPPRNSSDSAEITDQFLFYTGAYATPDITNWTKERAEYALAYKDIYGDIKDWYYNDMLVLPVSAIVNPSGTGKFYNKADMESWLNFIFKTDTQLGAINAAAKAVNDKLGTNKKVRINMSIPYLEMTSNFGTITEGGKSLSFNPNDFESIVSDPTSIKGKKQMAEMAIENRIKAAEWYINEVINRFSQAGYENLELNSFYWHHEQISAAIGEDYVVKSIANYLKNKGYYFTWIPYIGSDAPYMWRMLGFTAASLQPNFAFGAKYQKAIVPMVAELAKRFGMSVEIEYNDYATLAKYLNTGIDKGYMKDTGHTYYYGGALPIVNVGTAYTPLDPNKVPDSTAPIQRAIYDRIYEFTKGSYEKRFTVLAPSTNIIDKTNIIVPVVVRYADNFVEGSLNVAYDASKVSIKGYDVGAQIAGKGIVTVDNSTEGIAKVSYKINDTANALYGDKYGEPTNGNSEIVKLYFKKNENISDLDITTRLFAVTRDGIMMDKDQNTYKNWSETGIIKDSPEDILIKAVAVVKKAQNSMLQDDIDKALALINQIPNSLKKSELSEKVNSVQYQLAKAAVEKAENSRTQEDIDAARYPVNNLLEGMEKIDLLMRLDVVEFETNPLSRGEILKRWHESRKEFMDRLSIPRGVQ